MRLPALAPARGPFALPRCACGSGSPVSVLPPTRSPPLVSPRSPRADDRSSAPVEAILARLPGAGRGFVAKRRGLSLALCTAEPPPPAAGAPAEPAELGPDGEPVLPLEEEHVQEYREFAEAFRRAVLASRKGTEVDLGDLPEGSPLEVMALLVNMTARGGPLSADAISRKRNLVDIDDVLIKARPRAAPAAHSGRLLRAFPLRRRLSPSE